MSESWVWQPLGDIAPASSNPLPNSTAEVWNLSLEDVESGTGRVLKRQRCKVEELGSSKCAFDTRHVLYSKLRPYLNKVVVPDCDGVGTSELIPLLPKSKVLDREFLAYYLRSPVFLEFSAKNTRGANLPRIAMDVFWKHKVPTPTMGTQRRIVSRIKELFERVDEVRSLRRDSLTELQSLESAVFADFIEANRSDPPPGTQLGKIVSSVQYGTSQKASPNGSGVPILRMGNIQNGSLDTSDLKFIELPKKELEKYRLNDGDILFNRTNSLELVGKAATFQGESGDWVFASYLVRIVVNRSKAVPEYVTAVINSRIGREFIYRNASRAIGMVNINAKKIQGLTIPLPDLKTQQDLVEQLHIARTVTAELQTTMDSKAVDSLPHSILRKAFAGEL